MIDQTVGLSNPVSLSAALLFILLKIIQRYEDVLMDINTRIQYELRAFILAQMSSSTLSEIGGYWCGEGATVTIITKSKPFEYT